MKNSEAMSKVGTVVMSGLGRRECQQAARLEPEGNAPVWVDPESLFAPGLRELLASAGRIVWLYRRPIGGEGHPARPAPSLRRWIRHNRSALALRGSFLDKMEFVEVGSQATPADGTPLPEAAAEVMAVLDLVRARAVRESSMATVLEPREPVLRPDPELERLHKAQLEEENSQVRRQCEQYRKEMLDGRAELARLREAQLELERNGKLAAEKAARAEADLHAEAARNALLRQELGVAADVARRLRSSVEASRRRHVELVHELSSLAQMRAEWIESRRQRESSAKGIAGALDRLPRVRGYRTSQLRARSYQEQLDLIRNSEWFDAGWYLQRYGDVLESGMDPATHFHDFGWKEYRNPGPKFDTLRYMLANIDVTASGLNPLLHFIRHGCKEGRSPFPPDPCSADACESP